MVYEYIMNDSLILSGEEKNMQFVHSAILVILSRKLVPYVDLERQLRNTEKIIEKELAYYIE